MNSSFSCVNAQQQQTYEEYGKFELRNCVNKKFESNAISFLNFRIRTPFTWNTSQSSTGENRRSIDCLFLEFLSTLFEC